MIVATWNVNSIRARIDRLSAWLARRNPDVVCLQETKVTDDDFPFDLVRQCGYEAVTFGQRTYNGVAILSKVPVADVTCGLPGDSEARFIDAEVDGVHVISAYVPNGKVVGSPSYAYKLEWMSSLRDYLEERYSPEEPVLVCGDMNVAPEDRDVAKPEEWRGTVLFHDTMVEALDHVRDWGLIDTLRIHKQEPGIYSWWDYRMLGFQKNNGLRIDHIFATPPMAARCVDVYVDREERKGEKPSDHAPVIATFDMARG